MSELRRNATDPTALSAMAVRLYRVAKRLPCTCVYRRVAGIPVRRPDGSRELEKRCDRCETIAEYERLIEEKETK